GGVLRNESLKTISRQAPEKSSVTDAALAVERQLHTVRVGNNISIVSRAAVAWVFAQLSVRFEVFRAAVVAVFELVGIVEQRVLSPIQMKDRRRVGHPKQ